MHIWTFYHLESDHEPSIMQNLWKERQRKQERFHLQSISPAIPLIITLAIIYFFIYFFNERYLGIFYLCRLCGSQQ